MHKYSKKNYNLIWHHNILEEHFSDNKRTYRNNLSLKNNSYCTLYYQIFSRKFLTFCIGLENKLKVGGQSANNSAIHRFSCLQFSHPSPTVT